MKTRQKPQRKVTIAAEAIMKPHRVTGFACDIGSQVILLAANVKQLPSKSGTGFLKPDFARMEETHTNLSQEDINTFHDFLIKHDKTTLMLINTKKNSVTFNLSCDAFLENIIPIFEKKLLELINANPDFLKPYQEQSAWYFALPEENDVKEISSINNNTAVTNSSSHVGNSLFGDNATKAVTSVDTNSNIIIKKQGLN